ncbi:hypothetical protein BIW11_11300 [Tropilaelaps mercedesae]|uniref:Uncharacterized protein n=1 Tax=Tropilaelaps mercedesae TaxID=418985 RepID=A0A1V9XBL6_9ACAR|nr:hypothetical protein BIW11_11300 [Tropilaelaps mercedesae]
MVLVRVWSTDKSRKKLLNISDGEDLKRQAIAKGLARDPNHVRVYLEDGTEIEDDVIADVLQDSSFEKVFVLSESGWHFERPTSSYMRERRSRGYPAPLPPLNQLALNHGAHNNHIGAHLSNHNHAGHHGSNSQQANSQAAGNNGQPGHQGGGQGTGSQSNQVDREREMVNRNHATAMAAYQQLLQQQPPPDLSGLNNSNQSNNDNNTNAGDSDESDSALSGSNQNNSTMNGGGPQSPVTQMVEGDADLLLKTPSSQGGGGGGGGGGQGGRGGQSDGQQGDGGEDDDHEANDVEDACKAVAAILPDISLKTPLQGAWHRAPSPQSLMMNGGNGVLGGMGGPGVGVPPGMSPGMGVACVFQIPWDRLPDYVIQTLEEGRKLDKRDRLEMIRIVCAAMEQQFGARPARRQIAEVAREMVARYPQSLRDEPGEATVFGQGYDRVFKYLEARVVNSSKSSRKRTYGELVAQTPGDLRSPAATAANRASLLPDFW